MCSSEVLKKWRFAQSGSGTLVKWHMYMFPWNLLPKDGIHLEGQDLGSSCQGESSRGADRQRWPVAGRMGRGLQGNIWHASMKQASVFFFSPWVLLALNNVSHSDNHVLVHHGDPAQCLAGWREHSASLQIPYGMLQVRWNIYPSLLPGRHLSAFSRDDSGHRQKGNVLAQEGRSPCLYKPWR